MAPLEFPEKAQLTSVPSKRTGQIAEVIFQRLIEAILSGELPGGEPLREAQLAREWNVSRTPMREAVRRAAEGGFLMLRHNSPPLVRLLTEDDVTALYDLREILELHALTRAWAHIRSETLTELRELANRATPFQSKDWTQGCLALDLRLHGCWTDHCQNSWLQSDLARHFQFMQIFQRWIGRDEKLLCRAYEQHVEILGALEAKEKELALVKLQNHIRDSQCMAIQMFTES